MDKVRYEFNRFDIALKRRLQDLLVNVESEVLFMYSILVMYVSGILKI